LDEKVGTKESIPPFRFGLEGLAKKEVSSVEKKGLRPCHFHLGDQG
jgi:hypothetical protein